jgi:hypothetical protein
MATRRGETQLTLRVDLDADPITGSLTSSRGASRRFAGWIGLAAALEALRAERPANPSPPATATDHSGPT